MAGALQRPSLDAVETVRLARLLYRRVVPTSLLFQSTTTNHKQHHHPGQDLVLFNDTIYSNIQYGRLDATREEVEDAARQVGCVLRSSSSW